MIFRRKIRLQSIFGVLLALVCIAILPASVIANSEPWKTSIQIPVVVNVYNKAINKTQIDNSIEEANKLLKQADMKIVRMKTNDPPGPGNGDVGNDGEFAAAERKDMRTFGGKELKKFKNEKGIKLSFGQKPKTEKPNAVGVAKAPGGYPPASKGKPGDPTIILKYTDAADTGNTIAHELGHVMGITGNYDDPNRIMDAQGRGSKFSKGEIIQMKKFKFKFGKCASQWKRAFPATKDKVEFGATTDDRGDQAGGSVSPIYDLHQVYLTSVAELANIDAEIDVTGILPTDQEIDATYSLGMDIDNNSGTGITYAGYSGIERIVYVYATGRIDLGTFALDAEVENTISGTTDPLPEEPESVTANEIDDFEETSEPLTTSFFLKIPKTLLDLSATEIPLVTTAGENSTIYDTADLVFDLERWLKDATLTTFGTGTPTPGAYYPIEISGLKPNDPFNLYLDDTLVLSDTIDGTGSFSGGFVFSSSLPIEDSYFLTAQDSTGEFAYSMTCPEWPSVLVGYNTTWLTLTLVSLMLTGGYLFYRRRKQLA